MFSKLILIICFFSISFLHYMFFVSVEVKSKNQIIKNASKASVIKVRNVSIKPKPKPIIKKKTKKIKQVKKTQKTVKKIVKKANRKVAKKNPKIVKKIKKIPVKIVQKIIPREIIKVVDNKKAQELKVKKENIKNAYLTKVRKHIESHKKYPRKAKRLRQEGKVVISFIIKPDGKIHGINLKSKCPYKRLNDAALKILKKIVQFDPIPDELEKNSWKIDIPIQYSLI
ncbi:MAG: energy transducer TonB [Campylobacterales bacterium]|nr:energy transducer TonB [Campylobacterales bacterium]